MEAVRTVLVISFCGRGRKRTAGGFGELDVSMGWGGERRLTRAEKRSHTSRESWGDIERREMKRERKV